MGRLLLAALLAATPALAGALAPVDGVVGGATIAELLVRKPTEADGAAMRRMARDVARSTVFLALLDTRGAIAGGCTGTLVHQNVVLTAAHCVVKAGGVTVLFSDDVRAVADPGAVPRRRGLDVAVHPNVARALQSAPWQPRDFREASRYLQRKGGVYAQDLALVLLHRAAPETHRPVRLVAPGFRDSNAFPKVIAGYGQSEGFGGPAEGLLRLAETRGSTRTYRKEWDDAANLMETHGSAGKRVSACFGDSGGPVFVRDGGDLRQLAVTAAGDGRCREVAISADIDGQRPALREMFRYLTAGTPAEAENPF